MFLRLHILKCKRCFFYLLISASAIRLAIGDCSWRRYNLERTAQSWEDLHFMGPSKFLALAPQPAKEADFAIVVSIRVEDHVLHLIAGELGPAFKFGRADEMSREKMFFV